MGLWLDLFFALSSIHEDYFLLLVTCSNLLAISILSAVELLGIKQRLCFRSDLFISFLELKRLLDYVGDQNLLVDRWLLQLLYFMLSIINYSS
jgi:hypothetical protein